MSPVTKKKIVEDWPAAMHGLGDRLRFRREQLEWSQLALSEKSGVDKTTISNLEKGKRMTRSSSLVALAEALSVPPSWLFFGDGALPAAPPPDPAMLDGRRRDAKG